jgi:hypothetical protein
LTQFIVPPVGFTFLIEPATPLNTASPRAIDAGEVAGLQPLIEYRFQFGALDFDGHGPSLI